MPDLSIIFEKKPQSWGLRGDQYLWDEMKEYYKSVPEPETGEAFRQSFFKAFKELTGKELEPFGSTYIEKYAHGGMSSGGIYFYLWYCRLLPELMERFLAYKYNPNSPRIYTNRINYRTPTDEEKALEDKLIRQSNAVCHYRMEGIGGVKKYYPDCVEFVESIKDDDLKKLLFELSAQMSSLR